MKFRKIYFILATVLILAASCQSEASKKADKDKADSLDRKDQRLLDSAEKANQDFINSTDESTIVNDSVPAKPAK
jgi:hypothetical protein